MHGMDSCLTTRTERIARAMGRAQAELAQQRMAVHAVKDKCGELECDLAALRVDLAVERSWTAAQSVELRKRQEEADALAKALMDRTVEAEELSGELECGRDALAASKMRSDEVHAALAACQHDATVRSSCACLPYRYAWRLAACRLDMR